MVRPPETYALRIIQAIISAVDDGRTVVRPYTDSQLFNLSSR